MTQDRDDGKPDKPRKAGKPARRGKTEATGTPAAPARRGGGFRLAADRARPVLDGVAGRHGFAEADVLLRWPEVVGEALAPTCRPVKVRYGGDRKLGATLVVEAEGARAPEVEHLAPRIIERVNQFYGYRAITRVRIVQTGAHGAGGAGGFAEPRSGFAGPASTPTADDSARAAALAAGVADDGLRDALTRLGANVLARRRGGTLRS